MKFKGEGWEFAKFLRSLEQFIWTVKGQTNLWNRMLFNLFLEVIGTIISEKKSYYILYIFFPIRIDLFSVHNVDLDLIPKSNCNVTQNPFMLKKLSSVVNVHTHVKLKLVLEITWKIFIGRKSINAMFALDSMLVLDGYENICQFIRKILLVISVERVLLMKKICCCIHTIIMLKTRLVNSLFWPSIRLGNWNTKSILNFIQILTFIGSS